MFTRNIVVATIFVLLNTCVFSVIFKDKDVHQILKSPQPLSLDQFRKYSSKLPIFDTRQVIPDGMIKGSYWMTSAGNIQTWINYYVDKRDSFLIFNDLGTQQTIIGRLQSSGYTGIVGYNSFPISSWPYQRVYPSLMTGSEVIKQPNRVHLDIRRPDQWQSAGIIQGAILISLPDLQQRLQELKGKTNIYVNCASAIRARLGWSVLAKANIQSTVLDEPFSNLASLGFKIVPYTNYSLKNI